MEPKFHTITLSLFDGCVYISSISIYNSKVKFFRLIFQSYVNLVIGSIQHLMQLYFNSPSVFQIYYCRILKYQILKYLYSYIRYLVVVIMQKRLFFCPVSRFSTKICRNLVSAEFCHNTMTHKIEQMLVFFSIFLI